VSIKGRLLSILQRMGYPEWVIQSTQAFLQGRRTRIAFDQHLSPWITNEVGIPQGSPLSEELFLHSEGIDNRCFEIFGPDERLCYVRVCSILILFAYSLYCLMSKTWSSPLLVASVQGRDHGGTETPAPFENVNGYKMSRTPE
jgi:hypothetical protein